MEYTIKPPTVGDIRAVNTPDTSDEERAYKLAERCILNNGSPVGEAGLNEIPFSQFQTLIKDLLAAKKG